MVMEAMVCQLFFTAHDEGHKEWSDFTSVFVGRKFPIYEYIVIVWRTQLFHC